jgi:hypothetical protein
MGLVRPQKYMEHSERPKPTRLWNPYKAASTRMLEFIRRASIS